MGRRPPLRRAIRVEGYAVGGDIVNNRLYPEGSAVRAGGTVAGRIRFRRAER